MLEGQIIAYKFHMEALVYVVGSPLENELILVAALSCLFDSLCYVVGIK